MAGSILLIVSYASVAVFLAAVLYKAVTFSRMPIHLRWELYPVAHEKGRVEYGGSYLEEPDWWTKPRHQSIVGQLKVMIPEILFLAAVWEHNPKQWFRSFPFHIGLYLAAGLVGLLLLGGLATAAGFTVAPDAGLLAAALYHLTYLVGYAALGLGLIGAAALLARRTFDTDYAEYTKKADYFNLAFFIVTFVVALAAHALADPDFVVLRDYFARLLTFNFSADPALAMPTGLSILEIALASVLVAYIPLTHMSHFFIKWFTYHGVRWGDEPNMPGSKIEQQVNEVLQYPVSWSASHIRGDGKRTWVDVATSGVEAEEDEK